MRAREVHRDPALGRLAERFQVRALGMLALVKRKLRSLTRSEAVKAMLQMSTGVMDTRHHA